MARIYLDNKKKSWLDVFQLPDHIKTKAKELLFAHPTDLEDTVVVFDKNTQEYVDKKIFRKYKSYLNVPGFDPTTKKSYMFSSSREAEQRFVPLPEQAKPVLDFLKNNSLDDFNQAVLNWYSSGSEYIEMHSDCEKKLKPGSTIAIATITDAEDEEIRELVFQSRDDYNKAETVNGFSVRLEDGSVVIMGGDFQKAFRHGLMPLETNSKRLSLTFRETNY